MLENERLKNKISETESGKAEASFLVSEMERELDEVKGNIPDAVNAAMIGYRDSKIESMTPKLSKIIAFFIALVVAYISYVLSPVSVSNEYFEFELKKSGASFLSLIIGFLFTWQIPNLLFDRPIDKISVILLQKIY